MGVFAGLYEIEVFVTERPDQADVVRAWLTEMKHRTWTTAAALAADFPHADTARPPDVVFCIGPEPLRVERLSIFAGASSCSQKFFGQQ